MIYKNSDGRRVTVPFHAQKILHPKLLRSILRDANINPDRLADFSEDRLVDATTGHVNLHLDHPSRVNGTRIISLFEC